MVGRKAEAIAGKAVVMSSVIMGMFVSLSPPRKGCVACGGWLVPTSFDSSEPLTCCRNQAKTIKTIFGFSFSLQFRIQNVWNGSHLRRFSRSTGFPEKKRATCHLIGPLRDDLSCSLSVSGKCAPYDGRTVGRIVLQKLVVLVEGMAFNLQKTFGRLLVIQTVSALELDRSEWSADSKDSENGFQSITIGHQPERYYKRLLRNPYGIYII